MRSRRTGLARIVTAVLALVVVLWAASLACVIVWQYRDDRAPADAIVVLGAAQWDGRPSPVLRARVDHAIDLWRGRRAPRIVFTGGRGDGDTTTEAAVSRRYALRRGVPDSAIGVERNGRTTSESMRAVADMLPASARRVILVSDPFHMFRLMLTARRLGLSPETSPTRTSPIARSRRETWRFVLIESVKVPMALVEKL